MDWQPDADIATLHVRAAMLASARTFFTERNMLEVETPVLCGSGVTDPHIENIGVSLSAAQYWLRTSPEFHMKRLLAAGSGDIYQIGKAFRGSESGRRHQPEFTIAEWYRCGFDMGQMANETCQFISQLSKCGSQPVSDQQRISYQDAFFEACAIDPLTADNAELRSTALNWPDNICNAELAASIADDRLTWLDLIASHIVYPSLPNNILWVVDQYPADQAMLARLNAHNPLVANRFEVFLNGVELANGFEELTNAPEQAERFAIDRAHRRAMMLPDMLPDPKLIAALDNGLPECSGVAVGLDRILMIASSCSSIAGTMSFVPGR